MPKVYDGPFKTYNIILHIINFVVTISRRSDSYDTPWSSPFALIRQNAHKLLERLERFSELEIQIGPESLMNNL